MCVVASSTSLAFCKGNNNFGECEEVCWVSVKPLFPNWVGGGKRGRCSAKSESVFLQQISWAL